MNQQPSSDTALILSYLGLRKAIGIIGVSLPFVLAIGRIILDGSGIQRSISSYYYTNMGDVFVGSLCAIAVFLMSYRYKQQDDIAGDLACLFAIGVALFPTAPEVNPTSQDRLIGGLHHLFAALFFLTLAYFSLVLFRKTDPSKTPTRRKCQRNVVYTVCGYTILACIALIGIVAMLPGETSVKRLDPVFWLESVAVFVFGLSWLIKGETLLKDDET